MANQGGAIQSQAAAGIAPAEKREDLIRVLRLVEYVGPRSAVEEQVAQSIQGERRFPREDKHAKRDWMLDVLTIRATTLGTFPDILEAAVLVQALEGKPSEKDLRIMELERKLENMKYSARQALQLQNAQNASMYGMFGVGPAGQQISQAMDQAIQDDLSSIPALPSIPDTLTAPDPSFVAKLKGKLGL